MMRRWRIGTRLVVLAGAFVVFLGVVTSVGFTRISSGAVAADALDRISDLQAQALTVQYDFADLNGWQNAYALDVAKLGPTAAQDTATNRKQFLVVAARTRTDLDQLTGSLAGRPQGYRDLWATALGKYGEFMSVDTRIAQLYRQGGSAASSAADKLVNVDEVAIYDAGSGALGQLVRQAGDEQTLLAEQAAADGT